MDLFEFTGIVQILVTAENDELGMIRLDLFHRLLQHGLFKKIIRIQERKIAAFRMAKTVVAGSAGATVFLPDRRHTGIPGGIFFQDLYRIIRGTVVHADDLYFFQSLPDHTVQTLPEMVVSVIHRHDDRNNRLLHVFPPVHVSL